MKIEQYFPTEREYIDFVMKNSNEQNLLDSPICEILETFNINSKIDFKLEYLKEEYLNEYLMNLFILELNKIKDSVFSYNYVDITNMFSEAFNVLEELGTNVKNIIMSYKTCSKVSYFLYSIFRIKIKDGNPISYFCDAKISSFNGIKEDYIYFFGEKKVAGSIILHENINNDYCLKLHLDQKYILKLKI